MSRSRLLIKLLIAAAVLAIGALLWLRQSSTPDDPSAVAEAETAASPVDQLEWLAGCWKHEEPGFRRDEQWMRPGGGTLIGMSRSVAGGRTVEYEFLRIEARDDRIVYVASPSGQAMAEFRASEVSDRKVIFEAPEHDFPQRIVYELMAPGSILAWIDGDIDGVSRVVEFPLTSTRCP